MDEKQQLINRLKVLIKINQAKQKKYQDENGLSSDVGCITRESFEMARLVPKMQSLNIKLEDISLTTDEFGV